MVLAYHMLHNHHKYIHETLALPHSERVSTFAMVELYYERERIREEDRKRNEVLKKHARMAGRRS